MLLGMIHEMKQTRCQIWVVFMFLCYLQKNYPSWVQLTMTNYRSNWEGSTSHLGYAQISTTTNINLKIERIFTKIKYNQTPNIFAKTDKEGSPSDKRSVEAHIK